jgi:GTP-binding protein
VLLEELGRYQPDLLRRPRVVIGSRADLAGFPDAPGGDGWGGAEDLLPVSAVTGEGLRPLVGRLATVVAEARAERPHPERYAVHRPEPAGVRVERDGEKSWVVLGRPAERAVALSDLTNAEALSYAQGRLRRLGVDRALARAGAREGDRVRIAGFSFDYTAD